MGFQQGLSGLQASSKNLDVIGHNIANANTVGFKSTRAEFADLVANAIGLAGGNNSGIGVQVDALAQQFTQGSISVTGNNLDVAINGNGFFQIQQTDGSMAYTRSGNFKLDKDGNVITNQFGRVMGYPVDPLSGKASIGAPVPLVFPSGAPIPAKQTENIKATFNLDARAVDAAGDPTATPPIPETPRSTYGTSIEVFDSQGVAHQVNLYFEKNGANTWDIYTELDDPNATPPVTATAVGQIQFDSNGAVQAPTTLALNIDTAPVNPNSPTPAPFVVNVDFSEATQFGTKFAVTELNQDGYTSGQLTSINIGPDGTIMTSYSNGVTRPEARIALASFRNTQGLTDIGNNLWQESAASGQPVLGAPTDGPFGMLRSGALEDSNVDLTAELVNMMVAQRHYQANAQTIKTQDQVLSTIVNLR